MNFTSAASVKKLLHYLLRSNGWIHQMSSPKKFIGCIGKCTSGLTLEELDEITNHVYKTLTHHKGRPIFREFLSQSRRLDDLACLEFYEAVSASIDNHTSSCPRKGQTSVEALANDVSQTLDRAVDLNGVPEIDLALLERLNGSLETPQRAVMLQVLFEVRERLMDHLRNSHKDFKHYILEPCVKTK